MGSQYRLAPVSFEYRVDSMQIQIFRSDIFGSVVSFRVLIARIMQLIKATVFVSGNCHLTDESGLPIDSAAVYIYQSGSLNVSYSHCSSVSLTDLSGNPITAQYL